MNKKTYDELRKKGALRDTPKERWIIEHVEDLWDGLTNLTCPTCGKKYNNVPFIYNYCPNCGWSSTNKR